MRRHGVLRNIELAGDFTRRQAVRLMPYQQAERLKAGRLSESRKGGGGCPKSIYPE